MAFAKPAGLLAALVVVIVGYNAMASSRLFQLRRITVSDASAPLRADVEQAVRRVVGQSRLLDVDLAILRQKVEAVPRVRTATVARVLPDGIFVRVAERQPVVLVRRESESLIWLDEDAIEMGDFTTVNLDPATAEAREVPPVAKGFAEGNRTQAAMAEDRERIAVYKQIEREFREGPNSLWNLIDQIDLTFTRDVNLRLAHPPVMVHVGSTDFRKRFEKALQVLHAIKEGDSELPGRFRVQDVERLIQNADNINFIDAARGERIVVNFATPGAQKPVRQEPKPSQAPKKK
ncbi:MAG TPA: FtsQ-type POTRA domain-containing protein [Blastocatellia bacterium]|nr:FtsQ-type POTRA domain-containing protein [Blastocatellia bacterium]